MTNEITPEERDRIIALAEQIHTAYKLAAETPAATLPASGVFQALEAALVQTLSLAIPGSQRSRESRARWVYAIALTDPRTTVAEALQREHDAYEAQMEDLMSLLQPTRDAANRADDPSASGE